MTFCLFLFYILFPNNLVKNIVFPGKQGIYLEKLAYLLVLGGKTEEVVPKIASQVHCKGDVATQQTYRRYYASCHADFI